MGFIQNQNLTLGFIQTDSTFWEATTTSSAAVNSPIIVVGVLTFALQLFLVLFFVLRFWRFERRVQEALKQPDSGSKLSEFPYFYPEVYKQNTYLLYNDSPGTAPHATSCAMENYEDPTYSAHSTSVHWDLVQQ
ncbi:hypothetical protein CHARACLAT_024065 [Characodon lateralis]|uniref:Uncharacterized protein n=1 Tax=Characodon lateralis TaxID=208331 RepID=A0ABU7DJT1_9TELE|nr:hypothetical protein [Characodon lateralis]